jgi:hypothetical protein
MKNSKKTERGVVTLNAIVPMAMNWMTNRSDVRLELMKVFAKDSPELISHLIDKWNGDFASFYLNLSEDSKRKLFNYHGIFLEPDKYTDEEDLLIAMLNGKSKFEVFPFESRIVYLYYLLGYNYSLKKLKEIDSDAFARVQTKGIDLYGNGLHWSQAWQVFTDDNKTTVINYLIDNNDNI